MKKIYDLYGSEVDNIDLCRKVIQLALGIEFVAHESSYLGEYFRWGKLGDAEGLVLQKNSQEDGQEFQKPEYKHIKILLFVNQPRDSEGIRAKLAGCSTKIEFLERKELV